MGNSTSNMLLALDALISVSNTMTRLSVAMNKAVKENRDITEEELRDAANRTDKLVRQVNDEL